MISVGKRAIEESSFVIAMHPDEATEAMVDLAITHSKPFAVVCFSLIFPHSLHHFFFDLSFFFFRFSFLFSFLFFLPFLFLILH